MVHDGLKFKRPMGNNEPCSDRRVRLLKSWFGDDHGITSIEYALIGALIAVVIAGAVTTLGMELEAAYSYVASCVANLQCP